MKKIENLKIAVGVYKHDYTTTKNKYRKKDYEEIKKLYDSLHYFLNNLERSCGAIIPFLKVAMMDRWETLDNSISIGDYKISAYNEKGKIVITHKSGESGVFSEDKFMEVLKKFYIDNF